jgi:molecular chaperone DnaJ
VQRTCPACQGQGSTLSDPCKECEGNGLVLKEADVTVDIPAGIDSNMEFIVEGQGHAGERGAPRGDLRVAITVRDHPFFKRHGDDLVCQAVITYPQAALGCEIEIPTVDGKRVTHTLPRGTQSHEVLTISGQGMPSVRGRRRGNLLVQIIVETPRSLTKRQEELLRELADADDKNVSPQRRGWLDKVKSFFTDGTK